jgi:hypothetical protein
MEDPKQEFETALVELERWIRSKKKPTRHHARSLLVSLGGWLEAEKGPEAPEGAEIRERLAKAVHPLGEAWEAAVHDEMILACTEHVQSVDPRYLDHPRYDFAYTISARGDLEARLLAAAKLEMSPSEELLDKVARADALLLPYLEKRRAEGL